MKICYDEILELINKLMDRVSPKKIDNELIVELNKICFFLERKKNSECK